VKKVASVRLSLQGSSLTGLTTVFLIFSLLSSFASSWHFTSSDLHWQLRLTHTGNSAGTVFLAVFAETAAVFFFFLQLVAGLALSSLSFL